MENPAQSRIASLDLIRGVAVLGIAAVNIGTIAGPYSAAFSPNVPAPGSAADNWAFAFNLLFFEGKMRALFSLLFGASLLLYVERKDAADQDGTQLQIRRLLWLGLFGLLHFALFWDGDILFLYACVGLGALIVRGAPRMALIILAIGTFTVWQVSAAAGWLPSAQRELRVVDGTASKQERWDHAMAIAQRRRDDAADQAASLSSYRSEVSTRLHDHPDLPLSMVGHNWGETISYMMLGMVLIGSGFFGAWSRRRLWCFAAATLLPGLAMTLIFTTWAGARHYPELTMHLAISSALSFPHLLMALGYAALLVLAAPRLLAAAPGRWLQAAGKMAFSNYIASTVLMCAVFYGWGLGLFGRFGAADQWLFVLALWALLLGFSRAWLARFRQGPLEWLWRSLTEWRVSS